MPETNIILIDGYVTTETLDIEPVSNHPGTAEDGLYSRAA